MTGVLAVIHPPDRQQAFLDLSLLLDEFRFRISWIQDMKYFLLKIDNKAALGQGREHPGRQYQSLVPGLIDPGKFKKNNFIGFDRAPVHIPGDKRESGSGLIGQLRYGHNKEKHQDNDLRRGWQRYDERLGRLKGE